MAIRFTVVDTTIIHSTAIEDFVLAEMDMQLLYDTGVAAKEKLLIHYLMNEDLFSVIISNEWL